MKILRIVSVLTGFLSLAIAACGAPVNSTTAAATVEGWLRLDRKPLGKSLGTRVSSVETANDTSGAPLYHVVNLDQSGFVIVSGEDQVEPIIAFVEKGKFDPSPANPLGALIARDLPGRVARARAGGVTPAKSASSSKWQSLRQSAAGGPQPKGLGSSRISDIRVAPFIQTLWDQGNLGTTVTNIIWVNNTVVITTHFDTNAIGNYSRTSVTFTNTPVTLPIVPGNPANRDVSGKSVSVDVNNGPGPTVTNEISVKVSIRVYFINEFGDIIANKVLVGNDIFYDVASGAHGATVTHSVAVPVGIEMVVSDSKACYNYFTPPSEPRSPNNYVCGCVATAMAQLMYYFRYPATGVGTECFTVTVDGYPFAKNLLGGDYNGGPYDWNTMPLGPDYFSLTQPQAQAVGALTHDAGFAVHMQYSIDGSGAYMTDAKAALLHTFKYNSAIVNSVTNLNTGCFECNLYNMMNPNLDAHLPVLLGIDGDPGGHAIVVDGYGYSYGALFHHLNMGWSGAYNAWYSLPIIDLPDWPTPGTYSYFWEVTQCLYNVFTNKSGEIISGRVLDAVTKSPIAGATVTATRLGGDTYSASTDAKGIYALVGVPSGSSYTLTATNAGCFSVTRTYNTATSFDQAGASGNIWGADFNLTIAQGPPIIAEQPQDQALDPGASATFSITAAGELPLSYQWQSGDGVNWTNLNDGGSFSGSATATLTVNQSSIDMNGQPFQCVVTNSLGTATSAQAVLKLNLASFIQIATLAGQPGSSGSTDGTNTSARFDSPRGIAVDNNTNIYVADMHNHTIRRLTWSGTDCVVTTIAGLAGASGSADGVNSAARFNGPYGVALDGSGNIYVADTGSSTIRRLAPSGADWVVTTLAGLAGNNGSADGVNTAARFRYPTGVAVDGNGNLYVADQGNHLIRMIARSGTDWVVSTIAGLAGSAGSADGASSAARFNNPNGIAVDSAGQVAYVADSGNSTIRKLNLVGATWGVTTIAGLANNSGSADGTGSATRFNHPTGVALGRNGNAVIYVADEGNHIIRRLTPVGPNWVVFTIAGLAGNSGSTDGLGNDARFNAPYGVAVDINTNVYVTDSVNNVIRGGPMGAPLPSAAIPQLVKPETGSAHMLVWKADVGRTYQVQFATNLNQTAWNTLTSVTASNWTGTASVTIGPDPRRFYRVVLLP